MQTKQCLLFQMWNPVTFSGTLGKWLMAWPANKGGLALLVCIWNSCNTYVGVMQDKTGSRLVLPSFAPSRKLTEKNVVKLVSAVNGRGEYRCQMEKKKKRAILLFSVKLCHFRPNFQLIINQVEKFYFRWGTGSLNCLLVWRGDLEKDL